MATSALVHLAAVVVLNVLGMAPGPVAAADQKPLLIAEKNRVVANKGAQLIVMIDLKPNSADLKAAGGGASDLIVRTAKHYAREYLEKPEFNSAQKAVVYVMAIKSMDEYNRANFGGMERYGTLSFERKGKEVLLTENKLSFNQ